MFCYRDHRGEMKIDWEKGCIHSLSQSGILLTTPVQLPLFSLRLRMPAFEVKEFSALNGRLTRLDKTENSAQALYEFTEPEKIQVKISAFFGGEHFSRWRIQIINASQGAVEWVDFPQVALKKEDAQKKCSVYWPYNEGVQIDDIDFRESTSWRSREPEFPGEGAYALFPGMVESQFVAWELDGGVYLGAHDDQRGLKNIDCMPVNGGVRLKIKTYAGGDFGQDYESAFDTVLDLFQGGWMAAADIYRRWLEKNLPQGLLPVDENPALPAWYQDAPLVITYPVRGIHDMDEMKPNRFFPYENALPRIDELAEKIGTRLLVLLMHWEGTAPWAPPFVWPPYGGEEMLKRFIQKLHEKGHLLGVYLSGVGFTEQSNLIAEYNNENLIAEKGYARSFCLSPEQKLEYSHICTGQRRGYDLCPMGEDTEKIVTGEIAAMAAAGIDYAQILDQNHGGNPYFCFSRQHGHAPTPGPWMTKAMQHILKKAHETAPDMLFGCESAAGEPYLPHLLLSDNRFNLGWIFGKPIPIFAYLYHEYLINFMGNQVCAASTFKPDPESLAYRLAYSFSAGDMLTLILTDDGRITQAWGDRQIDLLPDEAQTITLLRNLSHFRKGSARKYLFGSRMLKPHALEKVPERAFSMQGARNSLIAPCVLSSRWQAKDGSIAQILVNWTKEEISCRMGEKIITVPAMGALLLEE